MTARIATEHREGAGPTTVFLPGYASDMAGSKALALDDWAAGSGRAFVRFDYRGCGASAGAFEDFTLEDWRDDALSVVDSIGGPVVLVGSSMGGWIMLLAALARPEQVAALVGIAAAPDFTHWGFNERQLQEMEDFGALRETSRYDQTTLVTTQAFYESGQRLLLMHDPYNHRFDAVIPIDCPVRLIQGDRDIEVPGHIGLQLKERLRSSDVQVTLVKDGDHRLSRATDIALLIATIDALTRSP